MARCSTPDTLIGIGGGGSKVTYRFMQQGWILDEVLDDRPGATGSGPDRLQAITIDTALNDNWHGDKHQKAQDAVNQAIADSDYTEEDGHLRLHDPVIVPDRLSDTWKDANLTAETKIRELCRDQDLNSWWMKKGREPLKKVNSSGFNGGVYRRRAVSKALYHVADHTNRDITPQILGDDVCIVTALGGGTGSGMAVDLASELDAQNVHLFGILPHERATGRERTNAHAALSELEYLELTGESPFSTTTLIPHIEPVNDKDKEFEMSVVRSILAHQNGYGGENPFEELMPNEDDDTNAPAYAPFVFAIPDTIRYDLKAIEQAQDITERRLDEKRTELELESNFYTVVGSYLKEAFPETAGGVLEGRRTGTLAIGDEAGLKEALQLRKRMEDDLLGTFLNQQALEIAGLEDTIAKVDDEKESTLSEDSLGIDENEGSMEQARQFINTAPERFYSVLDNEFDLDETDGRRYKLVEVLKQEVKNVQDRRDLWKAVSQITAEDASLSERDVEDASLSEREAELIRKALLEVVLDEDTKWLSSKISDPPIDDIVKELRGERRDLEERGESIEEFYETVANDIRDRRNTWYDDAVNDDAEQLAAIKNHRESVTNALTDLANKIARKADAVEEAERVEDVDEIRLSLSTLGPLGEEDDQIDGVAPIDSRLSKMGVDQIPTSDIEDRFKAVKRAKKLELEHGTGRWRTVDNAEEFIEEVNDATKGGWFSINEHKDGIDVEHQFRCSFNAEKLDLEAAINQAEEDAIDGIETAFYDAFVEDGNFPTHSFENEHGDVLTVPQGITPSTVERNLSSSLEASAKTDADDLLNDVLPLKDIKADALSTEAEDAPENGAHDASAMSLRDAYLRPIETEYDRISARLDLIRRDDTGLIDRLERVKGLAEGPNTVDTSLPKANPYDRGEETYGNGYVDDYTGIYEFDIDDEIDYREGSSPYVTYKETKPEQMVGEPDHIGETDIVENAEVETAFRNATRNLLTNTDGQAPFNDLKLTAATDGTGAEYDGLRVRQVYMSRGYEENVDIGKMYDMVFEQFTKPYGVSQVEESSDVYNAETHPYGWEDDITKVTFVGGIFLDNISLLTQNGGYKDKYESSYAGSSFIGSHHSIGLGAKWSTWETLEEWVQADADEQGIAGDFGGYVYRDEVRDVDEDFVNEIKIAHETDGESAKDIFLDMLAADAYESTIDMGVDD